MTQTSLMTRMGRATIGLVKPCLDRRAGSTFLGFVVGSTRLGRRVGPAQLGSQVDSAHLGLRSCF